jgi:hypothetical protein
MKTERNDDYNGPQGCFAILVSWIVVTFIMSIILNIALLVKLAQMSRI